MNKKTEKKTWAYHGHVFYDVGQGIHLSISQQASESFDYLVQESWCVGWLRLVAKYQPGKKKQDIW